MNRKHKSHTGRPEYKSTIPIFAAFMVCLVILIAIGDGEPEPAAAAAEPTPAVTIAVIAEATGHVPQAEKMIPTPELTTEPTGEPEAEPEYSEADAILLARLLYSECRGETREGWLLVAQCVLDRLDDGYWGDTVESVIAYPGQFAELGELTDELHEVAMAALCGERFDESITILYFCEAYYSEWYAPWLGVIGGHNYYGYFKEDS